VVQYALRKYDAKALRYRQYVLNAAQRAKKRKPEINYKRLLKSQIRLHGRKYVVNKTMKRR
jgi:hypothetical protein